jgi:hypothetical protein
MVAVVGFKLVAVMDAARIYPWVILIKIPGSG